MEPWHVAFIALFVAAILFLTNGKENWGVQSILDLDFYKLTMCQLIYFFFPKVEVTYAFKNRTKSFPLAKYVKKDTLDKEFARLAKFKLEKAQRAYLEKLKGKISGKPFFRKQFLDMLEHIVLPTPVVAVVGDQISIEVTGKWYIVTFWETWWLDTVVAELTKAFMAKFHHFKILVAFGGLIRLLAKITVLLCFPEIKFMEFGTRRRAWYGWQKFVIRVFLFIFGENRNFIGTSNVHLAMELGITPLGTYAHELKMVVAAIFSYDIAEMKITQEKIYILWEKLYGPDLLTALGDTFGWEAFFTSFKSFAVRWTGIRHDSGDPIEFGEKVIKFLVEQGVDPKKYTLVFSDGLDIWTILKLYFRFRGRIKLLFGWGTNVTNDLGYPALSLVSKPKRARMDENSKWYWCCKLTANLKKAMCEALPSELAAEIIEFYKDVFGYTQRVAVQPTY